MPDLENFKEIVVDQANKKEWFNETWWLKDKLQEEYNEFLQLAESSGMHSHATTTGNRDVPDAKYFIGSGKVDELKQCTTELKADVVIFNHALSPAQERNLELAPPSLKALSAPAAGPSQKNRSGRASRPGPR